MPWTLISNTPDKFFDPDYLPSGVQLVEISKMKSEALQSCYSFWHARQKAGDDAFLFKHVHSSDFRLPSNKKTSTHDPQEEGSGQHITRNQSIPDPQEECSSQHVTSLNLPPSAPSDAAPLYDLIILVLIMSLMIIRIINRMQDMSPRPSHPPSPHLDDVTQAAGKSKAKPIEMYGPI